MKAVARPGSSTLADFLASGLVPQAVCHSRWLARLSRISFLGALDYAGITRHPTSRLDHSLGSARLAASVAEQLEFDPEEARLLVTAAVLHDVGHLPLSHSVERAFETAIGINHHELSRSLILGHATFESESLAGQLEQSNIDPAHVWAILDRTALPTDLRLLALNRLMVGEINVDTLDAIPRAARALALPSRSLPTPIFTWSDSEPAVAASSLRGVDAFWRTKDRVYSRIDSAATRAFESQLTELVSVRLQKMRVEATEVLAWSDRQFLEWLVVTPSDLQLMMRSHAIDTKAQVIQRRRFLVHRGDHEGGDLRARDWRSRYVILREHPPKLIDD